jgi:hypothetical protein
MKAADSKWTIVVLTLLCVVCATAFGADGLVLHMTFDQGTINNGVAADLSGQGNDGLVTGDPEFVEGVLRDALKFDGIDDVIEVPLQPSITFEQGDSLTVMAWIRTTVHPSLNDGIVGNYRASTAEFWALLANDAAGGVTFYLRDVGRAHTSRLDSPDPINTDTWIHVAGVRDQEKKEAYLYIDGEVVVSMADETENINSGQSIWIGDHLNRFYDGLMDDVRIYDRALTQGEILGAMQGSSEVWPYASGPDPDDGALVMATWANITWRPSSIAVSHDVYLGDNLDDVNDATIDSPLFRGNQTDTFTIAGFAGFPYPDGLVPGTTYYWRIDEVNDADPNSPWKGDIWSFSIPPKTAYAPDPADGAEFVDPNAAFAWTPGFGAKLHTVYMGTNFDEVDNAEGGAPLGSASYSPGTLELEKTYYWRVDEFDALETHKGDIWSFTTPGAVGSPQPANGAVDVQMTTTLSWTAAHNATSHELYFGTDADVVKNATTASPEYIGPKALGAESYDPGGLAWHSSYAWRVDEVYPTETVKGLVWTFTTAAFILVDDFESYNDIDPPDPNSNRVFDNWIDGFGTTTNGALVGNDLPPYAEQTIVHGGAQSMPYFYDNNLKTSEATLTLVYPRDWTAEGVTKLSLWFRGASGNSAERMFVVLNGTAVVYHDDANVAQMTGWNNWTIDLQAFADQGADLTDVNTITIGFGTRNSPAAGGTGTVYFDDIRLIR